MEGDRFSDEIAKIKSEIHALAIVETAIREHINKTCFKHNKNDTERNRMCAALDVIGDTCLAMGAFFEKPPHVSVGLNYLSIYGIYQVLFAQQDAVKDLVEALDIPKLTEHIQCDQKLKKIRETRNRAVAHSTDGGDKCEKDGRARILDFGFINRGSITDRSFELMLYDPHGLLTHTVEKIDIYSDIEQQAILLKSYLTDLPGKICNKEEKFYVKTFKTGFANQLLPVNYYLQKVFEAINGKQTNPVFHLKLIRDAVENFIKMERAFSQENNKTEYNQIMYAIDCLAKFFSESGEILDEGTTCSRIFVSFLFSEMEKLKSWANEYDLMYKNGVPSGGF